MCAGSDELLPSRSGAGGVHVMWSDKLSGWIGTERPHHVEWLKAPLAAYVSLMVTPKHDYGSTKTVDNGQRYATVNTVTLKNYVLRS